MSLQIAVSSCSGVGSVDGFSKPWPHLTWRWTRSASVPSGAPESVVGICVGVIAPNTKMRMQALGLAVAVATAVKDPHG